MSNNNNLMKDMRLSRGMTVKEFADSIGISSTTVSNVENNVRALTAEMRASILRIHEMDEAFFFYIEQKKKADSYK